MDIPEYTAADNYFLKVAGAAAALDPLLALEDGLLQALRGERGAQSAAAETLERSEHFLVSNEGVDEATLRAVRRDTDRVFAEFARQRRVPRSLTDRADHVAYLLFVRTGAVRADFYDYAFGTGPSAARCYTSDPRERALLSIFRSTAEEAHRAVRALLSVRQHVEASQIDEAAPELRVALASARAIQRDMVSAYRAVGPGFVTGTLTPYLRKIRLAGNEHEGLSPSRCVFQTLDRLVVGAVQPWLDGQAVLAEQFRYRESGLPPHHCAVLEELERTSASSLVAMTSGTPLAVDSAAVTVSIRKQKVVHKSYADRGLKETGRPPVTPGGDVLSATIEMVRRRESPSAG